MSKVYEPDKVGKLRHAQECTFERGIRVRDHGILFNELSQRGESDSGCEDLELAVVLSLQSFCCSIQEILEMDMVTSSAGLLQYDMTIGTLICENDNLSHDAVQKIDRLQCCSEHYDELTMLY